MMSLVVHDNLTALHQVIDRLEQALLPALEEDNRYYNWISLPENEFLAGMDVIDRVASRGTFLDVGCGIGTKLLWAHFLGWQVAGIERHQAYVDVAKSLIPEVDITCLDAFDYQYYDQFDVVYAYHPAKDLELQAELENYIAASMRPGSLFFLAGRTLSGYEHIDDQVWRI